MATTPTKLSDIITAVRQRSNMENNQFVTDAEITEMLNKEVNAVLADPRLKARLTDLGSVPLRGQPATFGKLIADETEKWGKVIRFAGIKSQ